MARLHNAKVTVTRVHRLELETRLHADSSLSPFFQNLHKATDRDKLFLQKAYISY